MELRSGMPRTVVLRVLMVSCGFRGSRGFGGSCASLLVFLLPRLWSRTCPPAFLHAPGLVAVAAHQKHPETRMIQLVWGRTQTRARKSPHGILR